MLAMTWLLREGRHFLGAITAVAFSCVLLVIQGALVLGIFGSAAVYVTASDADLWIGKPGTQSVNFGQSIGRDVESYVLVDPRITAVECYEWVEGNWRTTPGTGAAVAVYVSGIEPHAHGMMFSRVLSSAVRRLLMQPGAVVIDRADLDQLGAREGGRAWINGFPVTIVGTVHGLRALGGVNVIASRATARELGASGQVDGPTYLVAKLGDVTQAAAVQADLTGSASLKPFEVWTAKEFAKRSQRYWLLDTGAGVAVLFMAAIVCLVGVVVTGQSLVSVVQRAEREYATLLALGVSRWALCRVVLGQAALIGCLGIALGAAVSALLLVIAHAQSVPVAMSSWMAAVCAGTVMLMALLSGLLAVRGVWRTDPSILLR